MIVVFEFHLFFVVFHDKTRGTEQGNLLPHHPLEEVAVDVQQGLCLVSWDMTGTHDDAVQDGKVGLLVPALEVTQAISQVAAHPGLNDEVQAEEALL